MPTMLEFELKRLWCYGCLMVGNDWLRVTERDLLLGVRLLYRYAFWRLWNPLFVANFYDFKYPVLWSSSVY